MLSSVGDSLVSEPCSVDAPVVGSNASVVTDSGIGGSVAPSKLNSDALVEVSIDFSVEGNFLLSVDASVETLGTPVEYWELSRSSVVRSRPDLLSICDLSCKYAIEVIVNFYVLPRHISRI